MVAELTPFGLLQLVAPELFSGGEIFRTAADNPRGDENHEFLKVFLPADVLEEPAEHRNISQIGNPRLGGGAGILHDPPNHYRLPVPDQNIGERLTAQLIEWNNTAAKRIGCNGARFNRDFHEHKTISGDLRGYSKSDTNIDPFRSHRRSRRRTT